MVGCTFFSWVEFYPKEKNRNVTKPLCPAISRDLQRQVEMLQVGQRVSWWISETEEPRSAGGFCIYDSWLYINW